MPQITYSQAKALRMLTEGTSIPASLDVSVVQGELIEAGLVRPTGYQITPVGREALAGYDVGLVEEERLAAVDLRRRGYDLEG